MGSNNTVAPSNATQLFSRDYTTVVSWIHNVSSNIVNQARVQFSPNVSARTIPNDPKGAELIIQPFGTFGRTFTGPFNTFENRFQFEDDLTWIKGSHTFKFGGSYRPVKYHVIDELWFGGQWTFQAGIYPMLLALPPAGQGALIAFNGGTTAGIPTINGIQGFNLGLPFLYRQGFGNPDWTDWSQFLGIFAQDSWKIGSRFTLDYGLRFDHDSEPNPLGTYNHVSPRLGFAWDPFGDQKTVIRAGGGIFQAPALYQVAYLVNLLDDSGRYINQIFKTPATPQTPAALWNAGLGLGRLPFQGLTAADAHDSTMLGPDPESGILGKDPDKPWAVVPIVVNRKIYGYFAADNATTGRVITQDALDFMGHLGALAGQVISNAGSREQFLVEAFHTIRSPAHSIQGLSAQLIGSGPTDPNVGCWLRTMHEEAQRLARLTTKVGRFARSSLSRTKVSLKKILLDSVSGFLPRALRLGIDILDVVLGEGECLIMADSDAISKVFDSLLENALAFSVAGEKITVELAVESTQYRVTVSDQGPGVAADRRTRIFRIGQSFPLPGRERGLGVGLPIARMIVDAHGGTLDCVDPPSGRGACFCFKLNQCIEFGPMKEGANA